jgi:hypothetical protein
MVNFAPINFCHVTPVQSDHSFAVTFSRRQNYLCQHHNIYIISIHSCTSSTHNTETNFLITNVLIRQKYLNIVPQFQVHECIVKTSIDGTVQYCQFVYKWDEEMM